MALQGPKSLQQAMLSAQKKEHNGQFFFEVKGEEL